MSIRLKIVLIVLVCLAVIFIVVWYMFFNQEQDEAIEKRIQQPTGTVTQPLPTDLTGNVATGNSLPEPTAPAVSSTEKTKHTLVRMASSFTERFGSYSNQSNYTNFEDLYDFMTSDMKRWAERMVVEMRSKNSAVNSIYFGITTKALSSKISNFDESAGKAEVFVKTQRREATGSTSNARIYYQDIAIDFVNEDGVWKVDGAFWQ